MQNGYREAKVPNNWKCHLSMSCQVDTQAHSIAPTFTRRQVDRSELQLNMPSSLLVCKQQSPLLLTKDVATRLAAPFLYFAVLVRRRMAG